MKDKLTMGINQLSKYIILFLFGVLLVLSILFAISIAENKALNKANAVLKEQVASRDAAIKEIDKNIASLKQQVQMAENICEDRLKARENVLTFLKVEEQSTYLSSEKTDMHLGVALDTIPKLKKVVSDEKSNIAIDNINSYWVQFIQSSDIKT